MSDDELESEKSIALEATEACREIRPFVSSAAISLKLGLQDESTKYFNVCTVENNKYCVEVSERGFRVVATEFDAIDMPMRNTNRLYETSHSLLQTLSEGYKKKFADALSQRLTELAENQDSDDDSLDAVKTKSEVALPTPLSARFPSSFAYRTVKDRIPVTITRTVDSLCRRKQEFADPVRNDQLKNLIGCLSQFKQELQTNKLLSRFEVSFDRSANQRDAALVDSWNALLDEYTKQHGANALRYFEAPWLLVECYTYKRINLHALNLGFAVDVFEPEKRDAYEKLVSSIELLIETCEQACVKLQPGKVDIDETLIFNRLALFLRASLWANHTDLSLFDVRTVRDIISTSGDGDAAGSADKDLFATWSSCFERREDKILANDSITLLSYLLNLLIVQTGQRKTRIGFVLDNSGFELVSDLCLAVLLIAAADVYASGSLSVSLYVKTEPWFVSDVTRGDFDWTLTRLEKSQRPAVVEFGRRLRSYLDSGRLLIEERTFWHQATAYCDMRRVDRELYNELARFDLVIFKGDLNYRKLVGDRDWPVDTSFQQALRGFAPTRLCALRTLKADVCVGLSQSQKAALDTSDPEWMVSGEYGVIQFLQPI